MNVETRSVKVVTSAILGVVMACLGISVSVASASFSFGSTGSGNGQFVDPIGITVAPSGEVYVADNGNGRIQRFTADGDFISSWSHSCPFHLASDSTGVYVGGRTANSGSNGNQCQGEIAKYTFSGTEVWSKTGLTEDFRHVTSDGSVAYFVDVQSLRIRRFDASSGAEANPYWQMPYAVAGGLVSRPSGGLFVYDRGSPLRIVGVNSTGTVSGPQVLLPGSSNNQSLTSDAAGNLFTDSSCSFGTASILGFDSSLGIRANFPLGPAPSTPNCVDGLAVSPDGRMIYATAASSNTVLGFDLVNPDVSVVANSTLPLTGEVVTLSASATTLIGSVSGFEWDLDGNGSYETPTSGPTASTSFGTPGVRDVGVRVSSSQGGSTEKKVSIRVFAAPPRPDQGISINRGAQFTNDPEVQVSLAWPERATDARLSNDGGFFNAQSRDLLPEVSWTLDSSGSERLPKTVYARFQGLGVDPSKTFQDDIILDETAPAIKSVSISGTGGGSSALARSNGDKESRKVKRVNLRVKASDRTSGVRWIQAGPKKSTKIKRVKYRRSVRVSLASSGLWVRVIDGAGNASRWKRAALKP